ncbi:unnamed protein product [Zymoseptoria tritici ST99CH_3D7]|uniref:AP complex mu/sigma subunit domain-containing protein n=1 Tax=Zymoseptoria tritici (strain ST99CH_3D7) TaxID=1276538 RepID=A0A1X7RFR2_ZYMT9|nr:unnamed protein product [Zymoseptoria tritici ST99CH_3D7]
MAIRYIILLSRQGKVRLAKWFTTLSPKDKAKIIKDVSQLVLARRTRMCNFLEYKDTKVVYRRYASLFFIAATDPTDNELITLEIVHRYVEQMDKSSGQPGGYGSRGRCCYKNRLNASVLFACHASTEMGADVERQLRDAGLL